MNAGNAAASPPSVPADFSPALVASDLDGTLVGRDTAWAPGLPEALTGLPRRCEHRHLHRPHVPERE